jgi:Poly(ADP-ribose) polymerase catalytic domain
LNILLVVHGLNSTALPAEEVTLAQNLKSLLEFNSSHKSRMSGIGNDQEARLFMKDVESAFEVAFDAASRSCKPPTEFLGWPQPLEDIPRTFFFNTQDIIVQVPMLHVWQLTQRFAKAMTHSETWSFMAKHCGDQWFSKTWSGWALWEPNPVNMEIMSRFPKYWRAKEPFKSIFSLEGPDFEHGLFKTVLDCQLQKGTATSNILELGGLRIATELNSPLSHRDILDMLCLLLDKAVTSPKPPMSTTAAMSLLDHALSAKIDITDCHIRILSAVVDSGADHSIITPFYFLFSKSLPGLVGHGNAPLATIFEAIEQIPSLQDVKDDIGNLVGGVVSQELSKRFHNIQQLIRARYNAFDFDYSEAKPFLSLISENLWLEKYIEASVWKTAACLPPIDKLKMIHQFQQEVGLETPRSPQLHTSLASYIEWIVLGHVKQQPTTLQITFFETLLNIHAENRSVYHKRLAFNMAELSHVVMINRIHILETIQGSSPGFCEKLLTATSIDPTIICIRLARVLATESIEDISAWTTVLEILIEPLSSNICEFSATRLDIISWIDWLDDINKILGPDNFTATQTGLVKKELQAWTNQLRPRSLEISKMSEVYGQSGHMTMQIYLSYKYPKRLLQLLDQISLIGPEDYTLCRLFLSVMSLGVLDHIQKLSRVLRFAQRTIVDSDLVSIKKLLSICKVQDQDAMTGFLWLWWNNPQNVKQLDCFPPEKAAFQDLVTLLGRVSHKVHKQDCMDSVAEHLRSRSEAIRPRILKLREMKLALKLHDCPRAVEFFASLGINESTSLLQIPDHLADCIDEVDNSHYDLHFPLDGFKPVQRLAMGLGNAQSLIVQVGIKDNLSDSTFSVRMHPEPDVSTDIGWATPKSTISDSLDMETLQILKRPNRMTYSVMRLLLHHFRERIDSLEAVYEMVQSSIFDMNRCIVCQDKLHVKVWRSTTCDKYFCRHLESWRRIQLINYCPKVLDLFLLSAGNISDIHTHDLLPGSTIDTLSCLSMALSNDNVKEMVESIICQPEPWMSTDSYKLLTYIASLQVFLTEATGVLRIPSLPGVHQFVVCSSSPEVEALRLNRRRNHDESQVVFHGTSVDRLFAILDGGLKAMTGTYLQTNGAAHGSGIYCSPEPSTALSYSRSSSAWKCSSYNGSMRLVLGCELIGSPRQASTRRDINIMVVDDATQLSVRYLFLFPSGVSAPEARFVVPAMKSAFGLLRAGSV